LCKQLRHDLTNSLAGLCQADLSAARDTTADVGTEITAAGEYVRQGTRDVAAASQKRVEQSLRCIEEYVKAFAPVVAATVEQLRYRAYTLGKAIDTTATSCALLRTARLYVLIDGRDSCESLAQIAQQLVEAGVDILQLRDKQLGDRELVERARLLRCITRESDTLLIINDRPDIAALSDADGVHVGQDELSVKDARTIVGASKLVGVSTHSIGQARRAVLDGANYIGCGPTFPSQTKQFDDFPGPRFLREAASEISLPAFAIGGIGLDNVEQVLATGFSRLAVGAEITNALDPKSRAKQLQALAALIS
jgi:thiamine-phosphate pyrophosphorylase